MVTYSYVVTLNTDCLLGMFWRLLDKLTQLGILTWLLVLIKGFFGVAGIG